MRARVVVPVLAALLLVGGTCAALSAGGVGRGEAGGTTGDGRVASEAKPPRARAGGATATADDAPPAEGAAPVVTDADIAPTAAGAATSDGFPPFEHRGGPLLLRNGPSGTDVYDPLGDGAWRPFLAGGAHVQALLGPGMVLLATTHCESGIAAEAHGWPTYLEVAETARGTRSALFRDDTVSFVAARGRDVIALETRRRRLLRATVLPGAPLDRVELDALGDVERVVAVAGACVFVATAGDDRLVRVPFDGSPARRLELRASERILPSPGGHLVAVLSLTPWRTPVVPAADRGDAPAIRVIDVDDDRETLRIADVDVRVSPLSSSIPQLEAAWADDRRLRWSESVDPVPGAAEATPSDLAASASFAGRQRWVEVDARTGERLLEVVYADRLGLRHEQPPTDAVLTGTCSDGRAGRFVIRVPDVFFEGAFERPAARATWAPGAMFGELVSVSPDGRFAFVCVTDDKRRLVVLLDGETRTKRILHRGSDTPRACGGDTHFSWLAAP